MRCLDTISALANVVLTQILWAFEFRHVVFGEDRKVFGHEIIPFDFTFRKQVGAFFDVFGGSVGSTREIEPARF